MSDKLPYPRQGELMGWANAATNRINRFLSRDTDQRRKAVLLEHHTSGAKATENGVMMWDEVNQCPVVSVGGVWKKVTLT